MASDSDILIPPAKEAIRGYMLKLVTVPAIILTAFSFFLGFLIKDVAMVTAKSEAQSLYTAEIASIMSSATLAQDAAAAAQKASATAEAASIAASIILSGQYAEFAKQMGTSLPVQNAIKAMLSQEAARLGADLSGLKALRVTTVYRETDVGKIDDSNKRLRVSCPTDFPNVVGGGFEVVSGDLVAIQSIPRLKSDDGDAGWEVVVRDRSTGNGGNRKFFAHAVCSNIPVS